MSAPPQCSGQYFTCATLAVVCRLGAGNPFADEQRGQEVEERVASLQAALSNSESQRLGLESEVATLRSSVDDLRKQHASMASTAEQDRRLREVCTPTLVLPSRPPTTPRVFHQHGI